MHHNFFIFCSYFFSAFMLLVQCQEVIWLVKFLQKQLTKLLLGLALHS